ncbi:MAG: sigma-54-dependent Fis family transcriptional regulator [Planctomycetes bacterium]|nr:sigma-54-dependent Fis family transcriptional regulator [Planctomycetota bacterium]
MKNYDILIVDDDKIIRDSLCEYLSLEGYNTTPAESFKGAIDCMARQNFSLVVTDVSMPDGDGIELLGIIARDYPQTAVIMVTGYGTIESAVEAIKKGAFDYLTKPIIDDELLLAVERALRQHSLMTENTSLRLQLENKYSLDNVISQNYKMAKVFEIIEAVSDTKTTILMSGDSGTGKSMIARAVHYRSPQRSGPFVEVSCGALPETLLESELFGHAKGAFTGAVNDKQGKFLAADGGTIFLDEISSASPAMQVKLLRFLQTRQFEPVGSNETITTDTRVILASNKDLTDEVRQGRFREDLFYRINVLTVNLPPLAERTGDVSLLAEKFLKVFCQTHGKTKHGITEKAMGYMQGYHWPGNVRQLENVIERAVLLSKGIYIDHDDLPVAMKAQQVSTGHEPFISKSLKDALAMPERSIIRAALEANKWSRQKTAKILQVNRTTLYKKMKTYGLDKEAAMMGIK